MLGQCASLAHLDPNLSLGLTVNHRYGHACSPLPSQERPRDDTHVPLAVLAPKVARLCWAIEIRKKHAQKKVFVCVYIS